MRETTFAALVALLGACTSMSTESPRLTDARSIARQLTENEVEISIASLWRSGVLGDIDCRQETGVDAEQCVAFMILLESRMKPLETAQRNAAMADATEEIEALATAIANLSDADFSALRTIASLPPGSDAIKPLSREGQALISDQRSALFASLTASDQRAGDSVQALLMEILTESDPLDRDNDD